jgi:multidrug efflux system outer membrane protein
VRAPVTGIVRPGGLALALAVLVASAPAFALPEPGAPAAPGAPGAPPHGYTLSECLALADRNFANLWAARARLALTHAQLDEAIWAPWFSGWSVNSVFGPSPDVRGTVVYTQSTLASVNASSLVPEPFLQFGINASIPLYTFGKLETAWQAAEANVRASEWELEKARQEMRVDVRRAYYGVELARDAKYVIDGATGQLDAAIQGLKDKIAHGAPNVGDIDRLRLEAYRQEIGAQALLAPKGEALGLGALRFITGVEDAFDIVDAPLVRPDRPLVAIAQYLAAARLLRPEVNIARAKAAARQATVDYSRAKLFPDIALTMSANYNTAFGARSQLNVWAADSFNQFYYTAAVGAQWGLDLLPKAARIAQAEAQRDESFSLEEAALGTAVVEVEKAYADALEAKGREETLADEEHGAKHWMAIVKDQIDLGTADEGALLEPLRAYGSARVRHLYALMDYNVTLAALAFACGWDSAAPSGS